MHACIFRLAFGHITSGEMMDPTTGIWTSTGDEEPSLLNAVAPAASEVLASATDHTDVCILAVQGSTDIESCDPFKPTSGADRYDVRRMGIAECRVAVFHISSYAWRNAYEETCRRWAGFITQCLIHQVDFVQGDGNLFAQRNFKRDVHSDYRTCILVDILNRCLTEINLHRTPTNRITYNICSSTSAAEYIKAQEGNHTANTDSMVTISLCQEAPTTSFGQCFQQTRIFSENDVVCENVVVCILAYRSPCMLSCMRCHHFVLKASRCSCLHAEKLICMKWFHACHVCTTELCIQRQRLKRERRVSNKRQRLKRERAMLI